MGGLVILTHGSIAEIESTMKPDMMNWKEEAVAAGMVPLRRTLHACMLADKNFSH